MIPASKIICALLLSVSYVTYTAQKTVPARKPTAPTPSAKILALQSQVDHLEAENKRLAVELAKAITDKKTYKEELERQKKRRTSALKFDIDLTQNQTTVYDRDAEPSSIKRAPSLNTTLFIDEETASDSSPDSSPELAPQTPKAQQVPFERDDELTDLERNSQECLNEFTQRQKEFNELITKLKSEPLIVSLILLEDKNSENGINFNLSGVGWKTKLGHLLYVAHQSIVVDASKFQPNLNVTQKLLMAKASERGISLAIHQEHWEIERVFCRQLECAFYNNRPLPARAVLPINVKQ